MTMAISGNYDMYNNKSSKLVKQWHFLFIIFNDLIWFIINNFVMNIILVW